MDAQIGVAIAAIFGSLVGTFVFYLGLRRRVLGWLPGDKSKILGGLLVLVGGTISFLSIFVSFAEVGWAILIMFSSISFANVGSAMDSCCPL